jgi:predicted transglutaminase-like cysteine proteinase
MQRALWAQWRKTAGFLGLAFLLSTAPIQPAQADQSQSQPVRLFGTMEFRTSLKVLPRWERILAPANLEMRRLTDRQAAPHSGPVARWRQMLAEAQAKNDMQKLKTVNRFFNQWPYRLDREVYDAADHWATPEEFMAHSGDCEDFGIAKYFTLRQLGLAASQLRLVVVRDRIRGIGHAVLAVYLDDTVYILDNLTDQVLPHTRYRHYLPQYSVNENHGWAHLPAKAASAFADRPAPSSDTLLLHDTSRVSESLGKDP